MLVLALDTSTLQGVCGWVRIDGDQRRADPTGFAAITAPANPGHAETLLDRIGHVLACGGYRANDVDLLVYGRGPGTFTGVRIGLATVKGIALGLEIGVVGISSLEALALSSGTTGLVAPIIDARRKELFGALYEITEDDGWPVAKPIIDERVAPAAEMIDILKTESKSRRIQLAGNGISPYRQALVDGFGGQATLLPQTAWAPSPFWMARLGKERFETQGPDDLDTVEPVYLREPDARLPKTPGP